MGRRKKYDDEGVSLFDDSTPLQLPNIPKTTLVDTEIFIQNSKETLGYIAEINKQLIEKIAKGEQPNYTLLKALNDLTRTTTLAMSSYDGIVKLETRDNNKPPSEINITIEPKTL